METFGSIINFLFVFTLVGAIARFFDPDIRIKMWSFQEDPALNKYGNLLSSLLILVLNILVNTGLIVHTLISYALNRLFLKR